MAGDATEVKYLPENNIFIGMLIKRLNGDILNESD